MRTILTVLIYITLSVLFVINLVPYIEQLPPIVNISQAFVPVSPILLILIIVFFMKQSNKKVSILVAGLIFILSIINCSFYYNPFRKDKSEIDFTNNTSVSSYNLSFFKYESSMSTHRESMIHWIKETDSDIYCFQEFITNENSTSTDIISMMSSFGYSYNSFLSKPIHDNGVKRGLIIFSKYEIVNSKKIFLSQNRFNGAQFADVLIPDKGTVRIINVHLESNRLDLTSLTNLSQLKSLAGSITHNSSLRKEQMEKVEEVLKSSKYPTIIIGDFNELPTSTILHNLRKDYRNGFKKSGSGIAKTLNINYPVPFVIDHSFVSDNIKTKGFVIHKNEDASDHFPITLLF